MGIQIEDEIRCLSGTDLGFASDVQMNIRSATPPSSLWRTRALTRTGRLKYCWTD